MSCGPYFEAEVNCCADELYIEANLLPNTHYKTELTDKFNKKFIQDVTSDSQGVLILDLTAYPDGLFNQYAGAFTLNILDSAKQAVTFSICGGLYEGFSITFQETAFIAPAYATYAFIGSVCSSITSVTPASNYFTKQFTPGAANYDILAAEHLLAAQIFSVEVLVLNGSTWESTSFTFDIETGTNKVTLHLSDTTATYTVILTGLN